MNIYNSVLKAFRLESLGRVPADHPCFAECLELASVMKLENGKRGYFRFNKGGTVKSILVVRVF